MMSLGHDVQFSLLNIVLLNTILPAAPQQEPIYGQNQLAAGPSMPQWNYAIHHNGSNDFARGTMPQGLSMDMPTALTQTTISLPPSRAEKDQRQDTKAELQATRRTEAARGKQL